MKRFFMISLILAALALNLTGCRNNLDTFVNYVHEGNYSAAITLYQKKLMNDTEGSAACREMIQSYLDDSLAAYAQGDLSRLEAEEIMHTMEMLEDYLYLVDGLEEGYTLFSNLRNSKADFQKAEQYRENGNLELALEAYSQVLPEDTEHFSDARVNMELMQLQMSENIRTALIQAYEQKDYPAVFQAYRDAERCPNPFFLDEAAEIREAAAMEYLNLAEAQAKQAFGGTAKDYNAAMESLRVARAAVSEEPDLLSQLEAMAEEYKAYIPVKLFEMKPIQQQYTVGVGTYHSDIYTDISGNTYSEKSVIYPTNSAETNDKASVIYNLNYAFSTFTATIYRPYGYLSYPDEILPNRGCVRIYGDDVLLYEFLDPGNTWEAFSIEVDVSGVRNLKIVVRGVWNRTTALIAPADLQPRICLAEGVLQK